MKKKRKPRKTTLTYKELEKQITTWKTKAESNKYIKNIYQQIEMVAREKGILTPKGHISTARKNQESVKEFAKLFKEEYGSYSAYKKKWQKKFKEQQIDEMDEFYFQPTRLDVEGWEQYAEEQQDYNDLITEFFQKFSGGKESNKTDKERSQAYETFTQLEMMTREQAKEKLQELLKQESLQTPTEQFKERHGEISNDSFASTTFQ